MLAHHKRYVFVHLQNTLTILYYLRSALNPVIYLSMSQSIRQSALSSGLVKRCRALKKITICRQGIVAPPSPPVQERHFDVLKHIEPECY